MVTGEPTPVRGDRLVRLVGRVREAGLLFALVAIVLAVGTQAPRFLTLGNARQILLAVAILAIVAVGETLVVVTRNVDLSVGAMVGLVAYVTGALLRDNPGLPVAIAVFAGITLGVVLGAVNGALVAIGRVPAIVATLGTLYLFRGIDFAIAGGQQVTVRDVPAAYRQIALGDVAGIPNPIIAAAVIAVVFAYLLRYTRTGRQLYAIGSNPEAARLAGIPSDRLVFLAFVTCGLLAGIGGILWGTRFGTINARAAEGFELQVIAAVVVGGVNIFGGSGTVLGAVLGAIMLGTIGNSLTILRLNPFWLQAISGGAIIVAVALDALITRRLQRALIARGSTR